MNKILKIFPKTIFWFFIVILSAGLGSSAFGSTEIIHGIVPEIAGKFGIPKAIILGIIRTESNFDPKAVSSSGAIGLMQVMPPTAEEMGVSGAALTDPYRNIVAGTKYLKTLHRQYGSWGETFSAYYMGPGNWKKRLDMTPGEKRNYIKYLKRLRRNIQKYLEKGER